MREGGREKERERDGNSIMRMGDSVKEQKKSSVIPSETRL